MKDIYDRKDLELMESVLENKFQILEHVEQYLLNDTWVDEFRVKNSKGLEQVIVVDFDGEIIASF